MSYPILPDRDNFDVVLIHEPSYCGQWTRGTPREGDLSCRASAHAHTGCPAPETHPVLATITVMPVLVAMVPPTSVATLRSV